ncbi:MAG: agmatine deiminase family protein [Sphingomonadaceae bacterium]
MIWLAVAFVLGFAVAVLGAIFLREIIVPRRLGRLFAEIPKTMRFDLATPASMRNMVVLAEPGVEPWFSERRAGVMLTNLRTLHPERAATRKPLWASGEDTRPCRFFPTVAPPTGVTLPPESGTLDGVLLAWPWHYPSREKHHIAFARAIVGAGAQAMILSDERQDPNQLVDLLVRAGIERNGFMVLPSPVDDVWIRDYGPTFVKMADGTFTLIANPYVPGEHPYRKGDNAVSLAVGAALDLPVYRLPLTVEGGNLVSDGHGLMVTSTATLDRNPELSERDVASIMRHYFGCDRTHFIDALPGEVTGHADMVVRFIDRTTVVVASAPSGHQWARAFDKIADSLAALPSSAGTPFTVLRLPLATSASSSAFWSYVNCTQVNGTTIVPTFGCETDASALDFYRKATGGPAIGLDFADFLVGSAHCQSKEIPVGALGKRGTP